MNTPRPDQRPLSAEEYRRLMAKTSDPDILASLKALSDPESDWVTLEDVWRDWDVRRLAEARKASGLTQAQLGQRLGWPQSRISRIERHPERASVAVLERMARELRVRLFLGGPPAPAS